jgi:hypothetical protein
VVFIYTVSGFARDGRASGGGEASIPLSPLTTHTSYIKPLKMDVTEGSETSANINQTPGYHPKVDILSIEHGESLKSRIKTSVSRTISVDIRRTTTFFFRQSWKLESALNINTQAYTRMRLAASFLPTFRKHNSDLLCNCVT